MITLDDQEKFKNESELLIFISLALSTASESGDTRNMSYESTIQAMFKYNELSVLTFYSRRDRLIVDE